MGFLQLLFAAFVTFLIPVNAGASPKVEADLQTCDHYVAMAEAEFSKLPAGAHDQAWVKKKLEHMYDLDQYIRRFVAMPTEHQYTSEEKEEFSREFSPRFSAIDQKNTGDLRALLDVYYWFHISTFGPAADQQAGMLVQHADNQVDFQQKVLERLENLYKIGETKPANYAYLYDRVASSANDITKRPLQRYGTQGMCTGPGTWLPWPVESERDLDRHRKEVGLGSEAEYIAALSVTCR